MPSTLSSGRTPRPFERAQDAVSEVHYFVQGRSAWDGRAGRLGARRRARWRRAQSRWGSRWRGDSANSAVSDDNDAPAPPGHHDDGSGAGAWDPERRRAHGSSERRRSRARQGARMRRSAGHRRRRSHGAARWRTAGDTVRHGGPTRCGARDDEGPGCLERCRSGSPEGAATGSAAAWSSGVSECRRGDGDRARSSGCGRAASPCCGRAASARSDAARSGPACDRDASAVRGATGPARCAQHEPFAPRNRARSAVSLRRSSGARQCAAERGSRAIGGPAVTRGGLAVTVGEFAAALGGLSLGRALLDALGLATDSFRLATDAFRLATNAVGVVTGALRVPADALRVVAPARRESSSGARRLAVRAPSARARHPVRPEAGAEPRAVARLLAHASGDR